MAFPVFEMFKSQYTYDILMTWVNLYRNTHAVISSGQNVTIDSGEDRM